ncbi:TfoX/Sxy family protein [Sphingoaurantiacus capsulatus]|uniref:TfoX/Sxy family protein n=1 Tax=Sphingoaurantiacus capsulatus TaxID=1771310 RepID=A0ABV7X4W9_9SPHN
MSDALAADLKEQLAPLGEVSVRKTFGELAVYIDKCMTGLILDGELYLKTDAATVGEYEGRKAFTYDMGGKTVVTSYRQVPDGAYDDEQEMLRLAVAAFAIAGRTKKKKK